MGIFMVFIEGPISPNSKIFFSEKLAKYIVGALQQVINDPAVIVVPNRDTDLSFVDGTCSHLSVKDSFWAGLNPYKRYALQVL